MVSRRKLPSGRLGMSNHALQYTTVASLSDRRPSVKLRLQARAKRPTPSQCPQALCRLATLSFRSIILIRHPLLRATTSVGSIQI